VELRVDGEGASYQRKNLEGTCRIENCIIKNEDYNGSMGVPGHVFEMTDILDMAVVECHMSITGPGLLW
jgi:hypothetical protein